MSQQQSNRVHSDSDGIIISVPFEWKKRPGVSKIFKLDHQITANYYCSNINNNNNNKIQKEKSTEDLIMVTSSKLPLSPCRRSLDDHKAMASSKLPSPPCRRSLDDHKAMASSKLPLPPCRRYLDDQKAMGSSKLPLPPCRQSLDDQKAMASSRVNINIVQGQQQQQPKKKNKLDPPMIRRSSGSCLSTSEGLTQNDHNQGGLLSLLGNNYCYDKLEVDVDPFVMAFKECTKLNTSSSSSSSANKYSNYNSSNKSISRQQGQGQGGSSYQKTAGAAVDVVRKSLLMLSCKHYTTITCTHSHGVSEI